MLYRFENNQVKFKDTHTLKEYSFHLTEVNEIKFVTINKSGTLAALTAYGLIGENKGIFLCDLVKGTIERIYKNQTYDLLFDMSLDRLYFNSGNTISSIDLHSGETSKVHKFSRINFAPISLCQNFDGSCLSYHKWKSDKSRLHIYDMLKKEEHDLGVSFYGYSWLDNDHIIYSLNDGLITLDIKTRKSEKLIKNAKSLIKQYVDGSSDKTGLNMFRGIDLNTDRIGKPVFNNKRIYFEVFLWFNDKKHIGIYSIAENKTDLQYHFSSDQGLIRNYGLLNDRETIYIFIEPNTLMKETINEGVIFVRNNEIIDFAGWLPVNTCRQPSVYPFF